MKKWDIPFVMYPYYIHMNSVLPSTNNIPNPNLRLTINSMITDVLNFPAYGFLGINIELAIVVIWIFQNLGNILKHIKLTVIMLTLINSMKKRKNIILLNINILQ